MTVKGKGHDAQEAGILSVNSHASTPPWPPDWTLGRRL
jgi:hypothetical protein